MKKEAEQEAIRIKAPNLQVIEFTIRGTAPLVQQRFWKKAQLMGSMAEGGASKSKKTRAPRDFDRDMQESLHLSEEGWVGVPAAAFRNACISACRLCGYKMTHAKLSVFVIADGIGAADGTPLVKLLAGKPERLDLPTRNDNGGADVRSRPMWREWKLKLRIRFDADQFTKVDIANLVERSGMQVGIGEGRPDSKDSNGMGFGTFTTKAAA